MRKKNSSAIHGLNNFLINSFINARPQKELIIPKVLHYKNNLGISLIYPDTDRGGRGMGMNSFTR